MYLVYGVSMFILSIAALSFMLGLLFKDRTMVFGSTCCILMVSSMLIYNWAVPAI